MSKIIIAFNILQKLDTFSAIQTFSSTPRKFKTIPEDLNFVIDGNPIHRAAQQYFRLQGIKFNIHQIIGLKNLNITSKIQRATKQIIERLNSTFQFSYYVKNEFSTNEKANESMYLFTTYSNYLRTHNSLCYKPPVILEESKEETNMSQKWNLIIDMDF